MAIARLSLAALGECGADGKIIRLRLVAGAAFARFRRANAVENMLLGQAPSATCSLRRPAHGGPVRG